MVSKPSAAAASSLWGRVVRTLSRATPEGSHACQKSARRPGRRRNISRVLASSLLLIGVVCFVGTRAGPAQAAYDPFGCNQISNYPHASSHVPGAVNAEVRTTCDSPPVWIQQSAQLWEKRWWGWNKIGSAGNNEVDNRATISTFANTTWCHNGMTVILTGSGRLMADDGKIYSVTSVSKSVKITNCP